MWDVYARAQVRFRGKMETIIQLLEEKFSLSGWTLTRPDQGHQKECLIFQAGNRKVFLKFGTGNAEPLRRLGKIGVAPEVLEAGVIQGKSFVIQEFIEGPNPPKSWFTGHLAFLSAFIRKYHEDTLLIELLSQNQTLTHRELVARDVAELEKRWENLKRAGGIEGKDLETAFDKLRKDAATLEAVELAPVHAEPNNQNMLLAGERLVMVDWDEIRLGDPVQDCGQMLWWYVPPAKWAEFFESYGFDPNQKLLDRLYWWTARASLVIACWQFEHGFDAQEFLRDFRAAVSQQANPHASF